MYQMLKSSVPTTQLAPKEGPDLTGIPKQMKLEFEERSGASLDDVRVQYNSEKPAQLQALAYTQGSRIYIAPGQERHLRHELVHVIQQKQGRVQATTRVNGMAVNDEERLEREADLGQIPVQMKAGAAEVVQRTIKDNGEFDSRSERESDMYDKDKGRWFLHKDFMDPKGEQIKGDHTTIHHIIPFMTLKEFWNIIVKYYPDMWGKMVKDILGKVGTVLGSGGPMYKPGYQQELLNPDKDWINQKRQEFLKEVKEDVRDGVRTKIMGGNEKLNEGEIEIKVEEELAKMFEKEIADWLKDEISREIAKEIDREAEILEARATQNEEKGLGEDRPKHLGTFNDLIDTVYTWMPGNLVVGPTAEDRDDDLKSAGVDEPALRQKLVATQVSIDAAVNGYKHLFDAMNGHKGLYDAMRRFIDAEQSTVWVDVLDPEIEKGKKSKKGKTGDRVSVNLHEARLLATYKKANYRDSVIWDQEAQAIINGIVELLAGQNITNDTDWVPARGIKYVSKY